MNPIDMLIISLRELRDAAEARHIQPEALEAWVASFNRTIYVGMLGRPEAATLAGEEAVQRFAQQTASAVVERAGDGPIMPGHVLEGAGHVVEVGFRAMHGSPGRERTPFCFWLRGV